MYIYTYVYICIYIPIYTPIYILKRINNRFFIFFTKFLSGICFKDYQNCQLIKKRSWILLVYANITKIGGKDICCPKVLFKRLGLKF